MKEKYEEEQAITSNKFNTENQRDLKILIPMVSKRYCNHKTMFRLAKRVGIARLLMASSIWIERKSKLVIWKNRP